MNPRCDKCRWWVRIPTPNYEQGGICKRFPPQVVISSTGMPLSLFPRTLPEDWCGQYAATDYVLYGYECQEFVQVNRPGL